jgi:MFS transporter, OFA family, oxalate/formate antiporter
MENLDKSGAASTGTRWIPLVGGFLLTMALGTFYATSVFMLPLEREFGWTRAHTSWITTFGAVMVASWFLAGGWLQDRLGPRFVAALGGILFSVAFFWGSTIHSLIGFYLSIGVCLGMGVGFGYVVPMTVGAKWFPDRRGLIVGLMVAGSGLGSGIFGPLASHLIEQFGWRNTMRVFSVIFLAMTVVATLLLKDPPDGYRPDGGPLSHPDAAITSGSSTAEMIRSGRFWVIWFAYCFGVTSGLMVISQLVPFVRSAGRTAAIAGFAIAIGAFGNAMGRILSGWMSDLAGRINTLRFVLLLSAVAMPLLFAFRERLLLLSVLLAIVYYCYGAQFSVYPSLSADFYGTKHMGVNYGVLFMAWGVAGVLGPFLGGQIFVRTGSYRDAFLISAALSLVSLALLSFSEIASASKVVASD